MSPLNNSLKSLRCEDNQLTSLPPLNTSLHALKCSNNQLTSLPPLNHSLIYLNCSNNQLTSLPPLINTVLNILKCSHNQLTFLPPISESLRILHCYRNELTYIPNLNESLETLLWSSTPIYILLNGSQLNIQKFNRFREYYFLSKLKKKFLSWMWKSREKAIREQFHYKHLIRFMEESDVNVDLEPFLENFTGMC